MTVTAAITTLLLPLGVWLVIASASPRQDENRFASSGLLALLVATAAFAAFGFAFVFGNAARVLPALPDLAHLRYSLRVVLPTAQPWSLIGVRGFFFQGVPFAGLALFLPYLALAQTCAVLVNSTIAYRSNALTQVVVAVASGGVAFGIAGHWIFGGGWLAMLGQNLGFGHGTIDVGGMATVGLIAGAFAIAFVITQPQARHAKPALAAATPQPLYPLGTFIGLILILIGGVAVVASNPLLSSSAHQVAPGFAINLLAASSVGSLFALAYTLFTSAQHKANLTSAAYAVLAALIAISSAGSLLPVWAAVLLGLVAGGSATLGVFWVQATLARRTGVADVATSILIANVFVPAVLSFIAAGALANGTLGAGWNGVGASNYLGVAQQGISGLLPVRDGVSDAGQLTAQLCGVLAVTLTAASFAFSLMRLLRVSLNINTLRSVAMINATAFDAPQEAVTARPTSINTAIWAYARLADSSVEPAVEPAHKAASSPILLPQLSPAMNVMEPTIETIMLSVVSTAPAVEIPAAQSASLDIPSTGNHSTDELPQLNRPPRAKPFVVELAEESPAEEGLLERMRKLRKSQQPVQPVRARKIAYPTRVAGRRLIRHMVDDTSPKP